MDSHAIQKWEHEKLYDVITTINIFMDYLLTPRQGYDIQEKAIQKIHIQFVIEQIYNCGIQCKKCILDVPQTFIEKCRSIFKYTVSHDSLEYLYNWINELKKIIIGKYTSQYFVIEIKKKLQLEYQELVDLKRKAVQQITQIQKREPIIEVELDKETDIKEDEVEIKVENEDGETKEIDEGSEEKRREDEEPTIEKIITNSEEELDNELKRLNEEYSQEYETLKSMEEDLDLFLPEDIENQKKTILTLLDRIKLFQKKEVVNKHNFENIKKIARELGAHRNVVKPLIDLSNVVLLKRQKDEESKKYEKDINTILNKIKFLDISQLTSEYNNFLEKRINLFKQQSITCNNYGLSKNVENCFVSSFINIITSLISWFDVEHISSIEVETFVKLITRQDVNYSTIDLKTELVTTLLKQIKPLTINIEDLNPLGNVFKLFSDKNIVRRISIFGYQSVNKPVEKEKDTLPHWLKRDNKYKLKESRIYKASQPIKEQVVNYDTELKIVNKQILDLQEQIAEKERQIVDERKLGDLFGQTDDDNDDVIKIKNEINELKHKLNNLQKYIKTFPSRELQDFQNRKEKLEQLIKKDELKLEKEQNDEKINELSIRIELNKAELDDIIEMINQLQKEKELLWDPVLSAFTKGKLPQPRRRKFKIDETEIEPEYKEDTNKFWNMIKNINYPVNKEKSKQILHKYYNNGEIQEFKQILNRYANSLYNKFQSVQLSNVYDFPEYKKLAYNIISYGYKAYVDVLKNIEEANNYDTLGKFENIFNIYIDEKSIPTSDVKYRKQAWVNKK